MFGRWDTRKLVCISSNVGPNQRPMVRLAILYWPSTNRILNIFTVGIFCRNISFRNVYTSDKICSLGIVLCHQWKAKKWLPDQTKKRILSFKCVHRKLHNMRPLRSFFSSVLPFGFFYSLDLPGFFGIFSNRSCTVYSNGYVSKRWKLWQINGTPYWVDLFNRRRYIRVSLALQ